MFKQAIKEYGRQIDFSCKLDNIPLTTRDIVNANFYYEGGLFKSVMKCFDIEIDQMSGEYGGSVISSPIFTVTAPNYEPQSKGYGTYICKDSEDSKDLSSVKLQCYDLMLQSMIPYDLNLAAEYEAGTVTVLVLLQKICERLGWILGSQSFVNADIVIPQEMYDSESTFRLILDDIAQVTAGTIAFGNDDKLYVLYPNETGETITPEILQSVTVGEKYGVVNALVFARMPQNDAIEMRDIESINTNGLTEVKFENNLLIEAWRIAAEDKGDTTADTVLLNIFNQINGLSFYTIDIMSFGVMYLNLCDSFNVQDLEGNIYPTILLSSNLNISQGIREQLTAEALEETETDYTATSKTDRLLNKTILRVDKQEGQIETLITQTQNYTNAQTGIEESIQKALERIETAEESILEISETVSDGATEVTTTTGYKFDKDGLRINKSGSEMTNLLDDTGMYVKRGITDVLTANNEGVNAINLTARQYLTIGKNSRFEDYQSNRTACFYVGG